jgi:UDP-3-O-[3-hydroxymyristoyl] N-acetylglucosamine deacetylase
MGLANWGSLKNAVVIGETNIVNPEGLRFEDEFVRHKTLDFIGDIFLSGHYVLGKFTIFKSGHELNNKLLHSLFKDDSCWRLV